MTAPTDPARLQVAEKISADHPRITANPWVYAPEQVSPGKPVVAVYRQRLVKQSPRLEHHLALDIYVSLVEGKDAEAEAEDALDDVLLSLQRMGNVTWTEARRVTFADAFTGYSIDAVMVSEDPYQQAVLAERRPAPTTEEVTDNGNSN